MDKRIKEILISEEQLKIGINKAANWLNSNYTSEQCPVLVGILKGCIPFIGSIIPLLKFDFFIDFLTASSFKGGTSANKNIDLYVNLSHDIKNKDVVILEDIIDTARTLKLVVEKLYELGAKSIKIVTLLDKIEGRLVELNADYSCFVIPNKFIVGFGLDYMEILRNLPYIGILKDEYIEECKKKKGE